MRRMLSIFLVIGMMFFGILPTVQAEAVYSYTIKPQYDDFTSFQDGLAFVKVGEKWGVIDRTGKEIVKPQYDDYVYYYGLTHQFREGFAKIAKDDKWGFIDTTGKEIVSPKYEYAGDFHEGLAAVVKENGGWGFVDTTGEVVIEPQYKSASDFSNGIAVVETDDDKFGVTIIDKSGKEISHIPYFISFASQPGYDVFNEGVLWGIKYDEKSYDPNNPGWDNADWYNAITKHGAIDQTGKVVVDFIYGDPTIQLDSDDKGNRIYNFSEGIAIVGENFKRVLIDTSGKEIAKLTKYDGREDFYASSFSDDMLAIKLGNWPEYQWGFIDKTGNEIVEPQYDDAKDFSEGLAVVSKNGKYGFINKNGDVVIKLQFDDAFGFNEGLAWIKNGGKWGAIDKAGKMVIKPQYDDWYVGSDLAYVFTEGLAFVKKGSKFGYIDKTGKEVIQPQFENAWYFNEDLAPVKMNGKWGFIANPLAAAVEGITYPMQGYKDFGIRTNIEEDKIWTITFNQSLKEDTALVESIYVLDASGEKVEVNLELAADGESVKVYPPQSLYQTGKTYYLLTDNTIVSEKEEVLKQPVSIKFIIK